MSDVDDSGDDDARGEDAEAVRTVDDERPGDNDALLSRLRVIEDQPLEARAAAFAQVYDELQSTLENGDTSRGHG